MAGIPSSGRSMQPKPGRLWPAGVRKKDLVDAIPGALQCVAGHRQVLWGHQPRHVVGRLLPRLSSRWGERRSLHHLILAALPC
jgi:hypothetical protein